jgi:predicted nucleotidyltransferase component of viral defense system
MIDLDQIKKFFPEVQQKNPLQYEYMLKEYFHYKMLDIIFSGKQAGKLSFIGGTNLRIIHGIARFSEDLDFDCFKLDRGEFMEMTDSVIDRLTLDGIEVHADDKEKDRTLKAFRRNLVFPGLMYNLGLSGHREKRFLIKIECEPHDFPYIPEKPLIQKFNVFTQVFASPADILLSMKTGALLERQKGRDFYDFMFLSGITAPHFGYLETKFGITTYQELYAEILARCESVDFDKKSMDFEKLVFDQDEKKKVRLFPEYIRQKL